MRTVLYSLVPLHRNIPDMLRLFVGCQTELSRRYCRPLSVRCRSCTRIGSDRGQPQSLLCRGNPQRTIMYRSKCKPSDTLLKDPDKKSFFYCFSLRRRGAGVRDKDFFLCSASSVLLKSVRDMHCLLFCGSSMRWSETTILNCFADRRRQLVFPREVSIAI